MQIFFVVVVKNRHKFFYFSFEFFFFLLLCLSLFRCLLLFYATLTVLCIVCFLIWYAIQNAGCCSVKFTQQNRVRDERERELARVQQEELKSHSNKIPDLNEKIEIFMFPFFLYSNLALFLSLNLFMHRNEWRWCVCECVASK